MGGTGSDPQPTAGEPAVVVGDPGYLPLHRLPRQEYENTLKDVLGTAAGYAASLPPDGGGEFDNDSGAQASFNGYHAERYLDAANAAVREVFDTPALKARLLICDAPAVGDAVCARNIIDAFGRRAWRRPLEEVEVDALVGHYQKGLADLGEDHEGALAYVLRIMLTSIKFTHLVEIDPDLPAVASVGRAVNGHELAARLSYSLWGAPPDDQLAALADSGALLETETLLSEARRLLDGERSRYFVEAYLGHYLHIPRLFQQDFDPTMFPSWRPELALAMQNEANAFLATFVAGGRPWSDLFTAQVAADTAGLSAIYESDPPGVRQGFFTTPAFLTLTSHPTRTSPVMRGTRIVQELFCEALIPPANVDITLPPPGPQPTNVRGLLEQHSMSDSCWGCHAWLDPIGIAFENFDALGRYQSEWSDGTPVDPSGVFIAGGEGIAEPAPRYPFATLGELLPLLAADARVARCATRKLLGYLARRSLRPEDVVFADELGDEWASGDLRVLVERLLESDVFRRRKLPKELLP
jgi:hypothetical protein